MTKQTPPLLPLYADGFVVRDQRNTGLFTVDDEFVAGLVVRAVNNHAKLIEALQNAIKVASEAAEEWDNAPSGRRAGKHLLGDGGHLKAYRADISNFHAALAAAKAGA